MASPSYSLGRVDFLREFPNSLLELQISYTELVLKLIFLAVKIPENLFEKGF